MAFPWNGWLRAFKEASPHLVRWVHLETCEVRGFNPRKLGLDRAEMMQEELYDDPSWVEVPYAESDDEYKDMRAFSVTVQAGKLSRDLLLAVGSDKPFREFRDALKSDSDVRSAWSRNRWMEAERRMFSFLRAMGIEPDEPRFAEIEQELLAEQDQDQDE